MGTRSIREIQQALKDKGFDPGAIDGVWGRKTIAAVKQFQSEQRLTVDGIVGPKTKAALLGTATAATPATTGTTAIPATPVPLADAPILPWFEEAKHLMGTKEILGSKNNPDILDWAEDLDIHYSSDDIPWCGLFVAHCVGATLPQEPLPANPLGARQWERFGDSTQPRVGAVMVFWRESPKGGKGHVGFYVGEDKHAYQILGGNQSDSVCLTWLGKDRFISAHWPKSASKLTSLAVMKKRNEGLSSNEA
jgi:uncharacterized protein (TIGR02594 family)